MSGQGNKDGIGLDWVGGCERKEQIDIFVGGKRELLERKASNLSLLLHEVIEEILWRKERGQKGHPLKVLIKVGDCWGGLHGSSTEGKKTGKSRKRGLGEGSEKRVSSM